MTQDEFTRRLQENKALADAHAIAILNCPKSFKEVYVHLRGYVACKYFLENEEMDSDNLIELSNRSIEKMAGLKRGGLEYADKSAGCTSVASSVTKKVLLIMSLQKTLGGLHFPPDKVAEVATVSDLTELIISQLEGE